MPTASSSRTVNLFPLGGRASPPAISRYRKRHVGGEEIGGRGRPPSQERPILLLRHHRVVDLERAADDLVADLLHLGEGIGVIGDLALRILDAVAKAGQ